MNINEIRVIIAVIYGIPLLWLAAIPARKAMLRYIELIAWLDYVETKEAWEKRQNEMRRLGPIVHKTLENAAFFEKLDKRFAEWAEKEKLEFNKFLAIESATTEITKRPLMISGKFLYSPKRAKT